MEYKDIITTLSPDQSYLICSRGGRVLHCSDILTRTLGFNASGKNLNDVMEDEEAAAILVNTTEGGVYRFECTIDGKTFIGGARVSQGGNIVLIITPDALRREEKGADWSLMRYIAQEINRSVANISVGFAAPEWDKLSPETMGLITKSVYNLTRISRNISTKVEIDDGKLNMEYKRGDLAADIKDTCLRAATFARRRVNISYADDGSELSCLYDKTMIMRIVLNLLMVCAGENPPEGAAVAIRAKRDNDSYVVTFVSAGGRPDRERMDMFGRPEGDAEMEVASMLIQKHGGSVMSSINGMGGRTVRMTVPIVEKSDKESFSNLFIDWYGGYDIIEVELSGILPPEAYAQA